MQEGVPLYPDLCGGATAEHQAGAVMMAIFDDSLTLASAIVAPLLTEWCQSGQVDGIMTTALRALRAGRSKHA